MLYLVLILKFESIENRYAQFLNRLKFKYRQQLIQTTVNIRYVYHKNA